MYKRLGCLLLVQWQLFCCSAEGYHRNVGEVLNVCFYRQAASMFTTKMSISLHVCCIPTGSYIVSAPAPPPRAPFTTSSRLIHHPQRASFTTLACLIHRPQRASFTALSAPHSPPMRTSTSCTPRKVVSIINDSCATYRSTALDGRCSARRRSVV